MLIDLLEAKPFLWDVYHTDYTNRGIKEMAYSIKTKIIGFRVQLGREIAKKKSTKSEQSTGKLCFSNWIYYDKLPFQVLVIGASKNRDTLKRMNLKEDEN